MAQPAAAVAGQDQEQRVLGVGTLVVFRQVEDDAAARGVPEQVVAQRAGLDDDRLAAPARRVEGMDGQASTVFAQAGRSRTGVS
jgi:hypothetical protein